MELPPNSEGGSNLRSWVKFQRLSNLSEFLMCESEDMPYNDPGFRHPLDGTNHASGLVFLTVDSVRHLVTLCKYICHLVLDSQLLGHLAIMPPFWIQPFSMLHSINTILGKSLNSPIHHPIHTRSLLYRILLYFLPPRPWFRPLSHTVLPSAIPSYPNLTAQTLSTSTPTYTYFT